MGFKLDITTIPDDASGIKINGIGVGGIKINGSIVWKKGLVKTSPFKFTVQIPSDSLSLTIPCSNVGVFDATVDWGDGSTSTVQSYNDPNLAHNYATAGNYQIKISGSFPNINFNNSAEASKVSSVDSLGRVGWRSLNAAFYGCINATSFTAGDCDTSSVTDFSFMMGRWHGLTNTPPNFTGMDTSNAVTMVWMFGEWINITVPPDLSGFNTSKVRDFNYMMGDWSSITTPPDLSNFDTSAAISIRSLFTHWNSVTTPPDITNFNTTNVTNMQYTFSYMGLITTPPDLSLLDTSNVQYMTSLFDNIAPGLDLRIDLLDYSSLVQAYSFLSSSYVPTSIYDATLIAIGNQTVQPNVSIDFGTSKYTPGGAAEAARTDLINNHGWSIIDGGPYNVVLTSPLKFTVQIPSDSLSLNIACADIGVFDATIDWGDSSTSTIQSYNDPNLAHNYATAGNYQIKISGSFPNIDMYSSGDSSKVISVDSLGKVGWLSLVNAFRSCSNATSFTAGDCDTSTVTNMSYMMQSWHGLTSTPPDFTGMDTSNVTDMSSMFYGWFNIVNPPDVSMFNTAKVTTFNNMFGSWQNLTTPVDVSGFNTALCTDFQSMFRGWNSVTTPPNVSNFNTSNALDMTQLFANLDSLTTPPDISGFDTSGAYYLINMFEALPQNIDPRIDLLDYSNIYYATNFLLNSSVSTSIYDATLIAIGNQTVRDNVLISFGTSKYTPGGAAEAARTDLINNHGWTITDGGAIVNNAPVLATAFSIPDATVGTAYSYTIDVNNFSDPDGDPLTIDNATNLPTGLTFDNATDTISGTPTTGESKTITIVVTDNKGGTLNHTTSLNAIVPSTAKGYTTAETTEWVNRKNNTMTSEWAQALTIANHFKDGTPYVSSGHAPENTIWRPTVYDGINSSPIRGSEAVSGWSSFSDHATIVTCAWVSLVYRKDNDNTNADAYMIPVRDYLLANAAAPELDFTSSGWASANNTDGNNMDVAIWILKWANSYRYIRDQISTADKNTLDTWMEGAGQWCLDWVTYISRHVRVSVFNWWDTTSALDYPGAWDPQPLYQYADGTNGPKPVAHSLMGKENRQQIAMAACALIGLLTDNQLFIERCEEYYRQTIQWGIIGDQCDIAEWQRTTSSTDSAKGINYAHILLSYLYQIGESVGRYRGNSALLDYETTDGDVDPRVSDGTADSTSTTPKSLRKAYLRQADIDSENPVIYSYTHAGVFDYKMNLYVTSSGKANWTSVYNMMYGQSYFKEQKLEDLIAWTLPGMVAKGTSPDGEWNLETAQHGGFYTGGWLPIIRDKMPKPV